MHIDARELDNNTLIEGDICIIGAGAAGISIALEWMDTPYKVILLEGGGFDYDQKVQQLYEAKTTGQKYFPLMPSRLHYFGGTTGHWGGFCATFDEIDFKKREWVAHSGWPFEKKELDPFYQRAYKVLELPADTFALDYYLQQDPELKTLPLNEEKVWSKIWQFSPPTRFGSRYKEEIVQSKNIHLYTFANVTNLSAEENMANIQELTVKNHAGKTHRVKAKQYIMACGAIQNARLLLASNKQAAQGIGNQYDTVGRFFMEHLEMKSAELWLSKALPVDLYLYQPNETKFRAELALSEKTQTEHKILNGTAQLIPLANSKFGMRKENWTGEANASQAGLLYRIKRKLLKIKENSISNIDRAYLLETRMEQSPNPNSRVSLDQELDSLGVPKSKLHWELTTLEKNTLRKMYEIIGREIGVSAIGRVKLLDYLQDENDASWPSFTIGGWHHIGTTKMNENPKLGVVDANCKVYGIANLFIAGSSCFPTAGSVNPTLTLVALSLRLSDHIKNTLRQT